MAFITYDEKPSSTPTQQQNQNSYTSHRDGDGVDANTKIQAILKVASLFSFLVLIGGFLLVRRTFFAPSINQATLSTSFGRTEYKVPYKNTLYENFGFVQDPRVTFPLKTVRGFENQTFLLDSGAVVTTMPLQAAHDTGVDLSKAKRITLQGFSGVPAFAYLSEVTIKVGDEEYELPATFTESSSTTYILGRKGLFDDYTINFDHEQRVITIKKGNN